MEWFIKVLKQYADFEGRARRKEYWMFTLIYMVLSLIVDSIEGGGSFNGTQGIIGILFSLVFLIPSIAVGVRRMHDVGKSGWYLLIPIYNLILATTEGDSGSNKYGPDPKNSKLDIDDHLVED